MSTVLVLILLAVVLVVVTHMSTAHRGKILVRNRRAVEEAMSLNAFR